MDDWDGLLREITRKADDSIAEMMARQAMQARAVQAKALQKIVEDGFKTTRDAADAYFKAIIYLTNPERFGILFSTMRKGATDARLNH